MPLGICLLHSRVDGGGEFIADIYRDYCKFRRSFSSSAHPTLRNKMASTNWRGAQQSWTWPEVYRKDLRCCSLFGEKWRPPRCFYSTACRTRLLVATRRTTGYLANTPTYPFCGLLGPDQIGQSSASGALPLRHTQSPHHLQSEQ